jgi:hypothetical protein
MTKNQAPNHKLKDSKSKFQDSKPLRNLTVSIDTRYLKISDQHEIVAILEITEK